MHKPLTSQVALTVWTTSDIGAFSWCKGFVWTDLRRDWLDVQDNSGVNIVFLRGPAVPQASHIVEGRPDVKVPGAPDRVWASIDTGFQSCCEDFA